MKSSIVEFIFNKLARRKAAVLILRYPESSPTDISPTDFSPTDRSPKTFPEGHFPDGHLPDGQFPKRTFLWIAYFISGVKKGLIWIK